MKYSLYFDGSCEPKNPKGIATYGYAIVKGTEILCTASEVIGEGEGMSNNVAEYTGLIEGLRKVKEILSENDELSIFGDSMLAINQMIGTYAVKSPNIIPLHKKAKDLVGSMKITFRWIPREQNTLADGLSHKVFEKYCKEKGYNFRPCSCGGTFIVRVNKSNGSKFWGCSRFPKCKNTEKFNA